MAENEDLINSLMNDPFIGTVRPQGAEIAIPQYLSLEGLPSFDVRSYAWDAFAARMAMTKHQQSEASLGEQLLTVSLMEQAAGATQSRLSLPYLVDEENGLITSKYDGVSYSLDGMGLYSSLDPATKIIFSRYGINEDFFKDLTWEEAQEKYKWNVRNIALGSVIAKFDESHPWLSKGLIVPDLAQAIVTDPVNLALLAATVGLNIFGGEATGALLAARLGSRAARVSEAVGKLKNIRNTQAYAAVTNTAKARFAYGSMLGASQAAVFSAIYDNNVYQTLDDMYITPEKEPGLFNHIPSSIVWGLIFGGLSAKFGGKHQAAIDPTDHAKLHTAKIIDTPDSLSDLNKINAGNEALIASLIDPAVSESQRSINRAILEANGIKIPDKIERKIKPFTEPVVRIQSIAEYEERGGAKGAKNALIIKLPERDRVITIYNAKESLKVELNIADPNKRATPESLISVIGEPLEVLERVLEAAYDTEGLYKFKLGMLEFGTVIDDKLVAQVITDIRHGTDLQSLIMKNLAPEDLHPEEGFLSDMFLIEQSRLLDQMIPQTRGLKEKENMINALREIRLELSKRENLPLTVKSRLNADFAEADSKATKILMSVFDADVDTSYLAAVENNRVKDIPTQHKLIQSINNSNLYNNNPISIGSLARVLDTLRISRALRFVWNLSTGRSEMLRAMRAYPQVAQLLLLFDNVGHLVGSLDKTKGSYTVNLETLKGAFRHTVDAFGSELGADLERANITVGERDKLFRRIMQTAARGSLPSSIEPHADLILKYRNRVRSIFDYYGAMGLENGTIDRTLKNYVHVTLDTIAMKNYQAPVGEYHGATFFQHKLWEYLLGRWTTDTMIRDLAYLKDGTLDITEFMKRYGRKAVHQATWNEVLGYAKLEGEYNLFDAAVFRLEDLQSVNDLHTYMAMLTRDFGDTLQKLNQPAMYSPLAGQAKLAISRRMGTDFTEAATVVSKETEDFLHWVSVRFNNPNPNQVLDSLNTIDRQRLMNAHKLTTSIDSTKNARIYKDFFYQDEILDTGVVQTNPLAVLDDYRDKGAFQVLLQETVYRMLGGRRDISFFALLDYWENKARTTNNKALKESINIIKTRYQQARNNRRIDAGSDFRAFVEPISNVVSAGINSTIGLAGAQVELPSAIIMGFANSSGIKPADIIRQLMPRSKEGMAMFSRYLENLKMRTDQAMSPNMIAGPMSFTIKERFQNYIERAKKAWTDPTGGHTTNPYENSLVQLLSSVTASLADSARHLGGESKITYETRALNARIGAIEFPVIMRKVMKIVHDLPADWSLRSDSQAILKKKISKHMKNPSDFIRVSRIMDSTGFHEALEAFKMLEKIGFKQWDDFPVLQRIMDGIQEPEAYRKFDQLMLMFGEFIEDRGRTFVPSPTLYDMPVNGDIMSELYFKFKSFSRSVSSNRLQYMINSPLAWTGGYMALTCILESLLMSTRMVLYGNKTVEEVVQAWEERPEEMLMFGAMGSNVFGVFTGTLFGLSTALLNQDSRRKDLFGGGVVGNTMNNFVSTSISAFNKLKNGEQLSDSEISFVNRYLPLWNHIFVRGTHAVWNQFFKEE